MASSAKNFSFFLIFTLLSSLQIHARDSQFFNKIPSTTNKNVVPIDKAAQNNQQENQDPNFFPENGNGYGLYGHESGQLPPSATTTTAPLNAESKQPVNKYLPKNYNPVAYVTVPEDTNDSAKFPEENNFNNNDNNKYYNGNNNDNNKYYNGEESNFDNQQQEEEFEETEFRSHPTATPATAATKNNAFYSGATVFRSRDGKPTYVEPQGMSDTRRNGGATTFNSRADEPYRFQPQGLSDTRYLENGKYFYDVNTEKYSSTHPYESLKGLRSTNEYNNNNNYNNNRNFYGNNENHEFNNENSINGGYQNQEEFQLDDNNAMP